MHIAIIGSSHEDARRIMAMIAMQECLDRETHVVCIVDDSDTATVPNFPDFCSSDMTLNIQQSLDSLRDNDWPEKLPDDIRNKPGFELSPLFRKGKGRGFPALGKVKGYQGQRWRG